MRILLITHFFPPKHNTGTENYTLGLARALMARGHEVQVLCAEDWQTGDAYWNGVTGDTHRGVPVHRIHLNWMKASDPNQVLYDSLPVKLVHETMQTSYAACNRGVCEAQGSIVAFIDADCMADQGWLSELIEPFEDAHVGAVAGSIQTGSSDSLVERFTDAVRLFDVPTNQPLEVLLTNNVAYRKHLIEAAGLFDEVLFTAGDVDLGWRVQIHTGAQVRRAPGAVVYHKHRSTLKELFQQYRRYGFSEILLDTLYRSSQFHNRTPKQQLWSMLRQVMALIVYVRSMVYRLLVVGLGLKRVADREFYLAWPGPFFIAEAGTLIGKIEALLATRGFRRNPFPSRSEIRRG